MLSVEFQGGGDSLWGGTPFFLSARRHHRFPARDLSVGSWHGSGSMGSAQSGIRVRGIPWSRAPESQGVRLRSFLVVAAVVHRCTQRATRLERRSGRDVPRRAGVSRWDDDAVGVDAGSDSVNAGIRTIRLWQRPLSSRSQ